MEQEYYPLPDDIAGVVRDVVEGVGQQALGGRLERRRDGWHWVASGRLEPRIRDLRLHELAPSYRCITYGGGACYVEIPRWWAQRVSDPDVRSAIGTLVREHGAMAPIYAEGVAEALDDHRRTYAGYRIPIEAWDAIMSRVVGCSWAGDAPPTEPSH